MVLPYSMAVPYDMAKRVNCVNLALLITQIKKNDTDSD
jgi:hypothetical protein